MSRATAAAGGSVVRDVVPNEPWAWGREPWFPKSSGDPSEGTVGVDIFTLRRGHCVTGGEGRVDRAGP